MYKLYNNTVYANIAYKFVMTHYILICIVFNKCNDHIHISTDTFNVFIYCLLIRRVICFQRIIHVPTYSIHFINI